MTQGFTVENLLTLDSMKGGVVRSGVQGLHRPVNSATVVDMPDPGNWANENEAVIMTDYPFRNDPTTLFAAIQSLIRQNSAVFCIKTGKNFEIPAAVLELCDHENFPLIQLPLSAIFSNIIYEITSTLLRNKTDYFKQLQMYTEKLIETIRQSGTIIEKLEKIEQIIGYKVVFVHKGYGLYYTDLTRGYLEKFNEKGLQQIRSRIYREMEKLLRRKRTAENLSEVPLPELQPDSIEIPIQGQAKTVKMVMLSVTKLDDDAYSIAIIEDTPLDFAKISALERVNRILSLEYQNLTEIKRLQKKYEDQFIINCLSGKYESGADISFAARAHDLYLPTDKSYWVIVVNRFQNTDQFQCSSFSLEMLNNDTDSLEDQWVCAMYAGKLTIILHDDAAELPPPEVLERLKIQLSIALNTDHFRMCIADPGTISDIPDLYQQALMIAEISRVCDFRENMIREKDLGALSILYPLRKSQTADRYINRFLTPLIRYDEQHNLQLCQTLYAFLKNNSNVKQTAEALFTHYNTVTYRLERIEKILGFSIRSGEAQFDLWLAFELKRLQSNPSKEN